MAARDRALFAQVRERRLDPLRADVGDSDLCATGEMVCSGLALACNDDTTSLFDVCDGVDNDCDPSSADGTEQAGYGSACDSAADSDLCATGVKACNGHELYCTDDAASTIDCARAACCAATSADRTGYGDSASASSDSQPSTVKMPALRSTRTRTFGSRRCR